MSFLGFPNPSCPCIDPWSSSSSSSGAGPLIDMNFMEHPFNATRNNMTLSVDSAFGTSCNSWWNEALQDDCRNNNNNNGNHFADERCFSRWCFVDPDVCSYSFSEFGLVDTKKTFISYEACGNLFSYQFESKYSHLKDSTVYISYPPVQNDIPYQYTRKDGTISGAVPEYIKHVFFQRMNINQVVFREVSQASLDRYGSKFTACVHDVAVGRLDMCIGAFFRTTERLLLSGFTTSFLSGKQILVVKSQHQSNDNSNSSKNGFWGLLLLPFGVFTIDAWVIMALACLYMAFAYRVIQRKIEGKLLQSPLEEFGHAAYDGVVNITSGSVALAPRKPNCEEKVIVLGFCVFSFIFMSAYTASFTLSLVKNTKTNMVGSIRDIVAREGRICCLTSISKSVTARFSFLPESSIVPTSTYDEAVELLQSGACLGALISRQFDNQERGNNQAYCEGVEIVGGGEPILEVPLAMPVSQKFIDPMNYVLQEGQTAGTFDKLFEDFERLLVPEALCQGGGVGIDEGEEGDGVLSTANMALPLLSTFLCTTLGLIIFFFKRWHNNNKTRMTGKNNKPLPFASLIAASGKERAKQSLSCLSPIDLIRALQMYSEMLDSAKLDSAVNKLPNKRPLIDLLHQHMMVEPHHWHSNSSNRLLLSHHERALTGLREQSLSSLYQSLQDDKRFRELANEAICSMNNPKEELLRLAVLQHLSDHHHRTDESGGGASSDDDDNSMSLESMLHEKETNMSIDTNAATSIKSSRWRVVADFESKHRFFG